MIKVAIVVGSTRPGRKAPNIAHWVMEQASRRTDAEFEILDIADFDLPLIDEPVPPARGQYTKEHTKKWAGAVSRSDGYVFVTPEYNHTASPALTNAVNFLFAEWGNKAAGFVSYGAQANGVRAVEHLRLLLAPLGVATVGAQLGLSLLTDFEAFQTFRPTIQHEATLDSVLRQTVLWSNAMAGLRSAQGRDFVAGPEQRKAAQ